MWNMNSNGLGSIVAIIWIANLVIHIALASAVWNDSNELHQQGRRLAFFGPHLWSLTTLLGGIVAAGFYWIIHHSTISRVE